MRAPFSYYGGKIGLADRIVQLFPPHRVYIEPYAGSLAVLFEKQPAAIEIVNDIDGAIVAFFACLRDRPADLERVCRLTPYARDEFAACAVLDDPALEQLEVARRFWVRVNQSFAKTAGTFTGWSVTTACTQAPPSAVAGRLDRFEECARRLAQVIIENRDAADLIARLATADSLVYIDPPYPAEVRKGRASWVATDEEGRDYRHDMSSETSHRTLAAVLHETPATVILSGYPGGLYDELFGDWWSIDFATVAHSANAAATSRGARVERLWSNRALDDGRLFSVGG